MCIQKFLDLKQKHNSKRIFLDDPNDVYLKTIQDDAEDVLAVLEQEEKNNFFQKAFSQLGKNCQHLLTAFYIDEQSDKQIAENTGRTEGAIRVAKLECRRKLKHYFSAFNLGS